MDQFIQTGDAKFLEHGGLQFQKTKAFNSYSCCVAQIVNVSQVFIPAALCPVGTCCPSTYFHEFDLSVRRNTPPLFRSS